MDNHAHTFNPKDDSLEMRADALVQALREHRDVQLSMGLVNNNKAHARLGSKEEIEYAFQVSQNTIEKGLKSLSSAEMKYVQENLLSKQDAVELEKMRRTEMIKSSRVQSMDKDYSKEK